jgi:hypothetical protein
MRVKRKGEDATHVARRYGDFARLHRALRLELPGKVLPALPRKNKADTQAATIFGSLSLGGGGDDGDDASSVSSVSTQKSAVSNGDVALSPRLSDNHRRGSSVSSAWASPRLPLSPQAATFASASKLSPAMAQGRFEVRAREAFMEGHRGRGGMVEGIVEGIVGSGIVHTHTHTH